MSAGFDERREKLAVSGLVTDRYELEQRLGRDSGAEQKVSDETMKRFKGFVTSRVTHLDPNHTNEDTDKKIGRYSVNSKDWLVPINVIQYDVFDDKDSDEQEVQFSIGAGPSETEVLGMHIGAGDVQCYIAGEEQIEADDNMVNATLDSIERMEAEGVITLAE